VPSNPHSDYHQQAAQHFGLTNGPAASPYQSPTAGPSFGGRSTGTPNPAPWAQPTSTPPGGPASGFSLQPDVACWIAAGLSLVGMLIWPDLGWAVLILAGGVGGWYARTRRLAWPPDVQDLLGRMHLAPPVPAGPRPGGSGQPAAARVPVIPLRPLTFGEILSGGLRVMLKNWPTLIGIPTAILVAFITVFGLVAIAMFSAALGATSSMSGLMFTSVATASDVFGTLMGMMLLYLIVTCAVALPADALLIALSVIATDKAVRGEPVRLGEVFRLARTRMWATCRLTLTFYLIFTIPEFLITMFASLFAGVGGFVLASLGCFAYAFTVGIMLSLSPIVLVVERRGVVDSLKRSMALAKPALGRLLGVHALWVVCVTPLMIVSFLLFANPVIFVLLLAGLIACFRTLQMLIYTDLRIRQENYDRELLVDWERNARR
jgi:hypothetical protein